MLHQAFVNVGLFFDMIQNYLYSLGDNFLAPLAILFTITLTISFAGLLIHRL